MKILQCLMGLDIGGAETHVVELSKELVRRGHEVTVASNGGIFEAELRTSGVKHILIPMHSKKPHYVITSLIKLKKLMKEFQPEIVHSHARIPNMYASHFQKKYAYRLITTAHFNFVTNWILKRIAKWGNEIFVVSDDIKKYLLDNYDVSSARIYKTINGVDTKRFSRLNESGINKRIIHVSRYSEFTSQVARYLIEYSKTTDYEIVIVGDGTKINDLKALANHCKNVIFYGPTNEVEKALATGDIFVGISRAALEAMSMNMPVLLAGDYGYTGVITQDKLEQAMLTNFTARGEAVMNYDKFKEDLDKLTNMPVDQFSWERDFIIANYSIEKMVDDYEKVYLYE